jgi:uncharacterized protein
MIRLLPFVLFASTLVAQAPTDLAMERSGYLAWLKKAPNSPLRAVAQRRVAEGLTLGPGDSDIPLDSIPRYRLSSSSSGFVLEGAAGRRTIGRGRPYRIENYALYLTGTGSGTVLTVFTDKVQREPPGYYDYDPALVFTGPLLRSKSPERLRVLASDGMQAEATEVGTVVVPLAGGVTLRVLRIPIAGGEESELEIFFQDETNGKGSYPAGRFVSLIPGGEGKFRLDFNRARNPYCAYSSAYPCPLPWRGNRIPHPIRAGERYAGGGLDTPPLEEDPK